MSEKESQINFSSGKKNVIFIELVDSDSEEDRDDRMLMIDDDDVVDDEDSDDDDHNKKMNDLPA